MKVFSYLNSLTRQQQIIFILTLSLLVLIVLSFFLNFIQKTANNLEIERNKILTEERLINKINFFPGFVNQDNVSISSLITNTSGDFKITIDRTQVIDEESIIVWINDADFMRLYDWPVIKSHKICIIYPCLLYTSPSPRDLSTSRMPSSA